MIARFVHEYALRIAIQATGAIRVIPYAQKMCGVRLDLTLENEQDREQNLTTLSLKRHQDKKEVIDNNRQK
jgi:hypothetical protein